jgi:putative chitinase
MQIEGLKPHLPAPVFDELPGICEQHKINTKLRLAHFLAQCAHESVNFSVKLENLNYSAERLMQIFPKYFKPSEFSLYSRQPEKIANRVYANRMGNGDETSGDGYKYRGRGFIQLTGKDNYRLFGQSIGADLIAIPGLVASQYPLSSAAFFFSNNNLWPLCDRGDTVEAVKMVTNAVNGGYNGLENRIKLFCDYMAILNKADNV